MRAKKKIMADSEMDIDYDSHEHLHSNDMADMLLCSESFKH